MRLAKIGLGQKTGFAAEYRVLVQGSFLTVVKFEFVEANVLSWMNQAVKAIDFGGNTVEDGLRIRPPLGPYDTKGAVHAVSQVSVIQYYQLVFLHSLQMPANGTTDLNTVVQALGLLGCLGQ